MKINEETEPLLIKIVFVIVVVFLLFFGVASAVFMVRNPKANQMQCYTYFMEVIKFEKVEKFQ